MLKIGSHVSMSGKKMLLASSEEAVSYGANTMMIYTGAPQNTRRKKIEELNIDAGTLHMKEHGINDLIVHAPYIINIGNTVNPATFELGVNFLGTEIERTTALGAKQIVLHPGAHVGEGAEKGISKIIEGLNEVLTADQEVQIALETMAGKGSECGRSFEELAQIIDGVTHNEKLTVCFDTCHTHDAGYDIVNDFDGVLEEFDRLVGVDRIKVVHVNDSKNERGAGKDRHENIGFGHIGFDALDYIIHHPQLSEVPKILETPYVGADKKNKKAPYKHEIEMIKGRQFDTDLLEKITGELTVN
ncbi:deoxyribonuclease IV [Bacillus norwichensis]|uniref:Probable endonuclease 4 n=1 Tax=Bacillus norwichensis TaxID=2762217 RepID=A0ABR8VFN3_9BACI|nr:deoxyribonuclease IV [Bacillus norwichensis]MBD8003586.1 deoxyribonuclease IV [Bacillus norwichensis]